MLIRENEHFLSQCSSISWIAYSAKIWHPVLYGGITSPSHEANVISLAFPGRRCSHFAAADRRHP